MPTLAEALTAMRTVIGTQLIGTDEVKELLDAHELYLFDKLIDARPGNPEEGSNLGERIWLVTGNHETHFDYSNAQAMLIRRYELGIGTGASLKLSDAEKIEAAVMTTLTRLWKEQDYNGDPIDMDQFLPLRVESLCLIGATVSDREPVLDPEEFQLVMDLSQVAFVSFADLMA